MVILTDHQKQKKKKGLCAFNRCPSCKAKDKSFCHRHVKYIFAQNNPEKHCFDQRKANAKRRGHEWGLTFEEFLEFLKENPDYMTKKGTKVRSLCIDRVNNKRGYFKDNIASVTIQYNSWKRNHIDYQNTNPNADNYVPF